MTVAEVRKERCLACGPWQRESVTVNGSADRTCQSNTSAVLMNSSLCPGDDCRVVAQAEGAQAGDCDGPDESLISVSSAAAPTQTPSGSSSAVPGRLPAIA